jgi:GTPase
VAAQRSAPDRRKKRVAPPREGAEAGPPRSGTVAIVGRPNVGKSTLLNAALDQPLSIVSPTPQTTRDAILGVVRHGGAEIALLDTPGLHRPRSELGRVMNEAAREAARGADVVVFVADAASSKRAVLAPHPGDLTLLADIGADKPTVLVVNKVDLVRDKTKLFPLLEALGKVRTFAAVVPISARDPRGVARVLDEVAKLCPEGPPRYAPDDLTDRPLRFFAAEYVREQILHATEAEVPHAVAVAIDRFVEPIPKAPGDRVTGAVHIDATICVERQGQKRILIGTGGEMLKRIGTRARLRIQELTGRKVNLKLWVRVAPAWRQSREKLDELGYSTHGDAAATVELPEEATEEEGAS